MRVLSGTSNDERARRVSRFIKLKASELVDDARLQLLEYKYGAQSFSVLAMDHPKQALRDLGRWLWQAVFCVSTALILLWLLVLRWGEIGTFEDSIQRCQWSNWERWPASAVPHHLVFIADPQLVDPHTYPGRPWPLSTLTIKHTDNYMRRSYSRLQRYLDPDTIFFLGDLFDGGREWSTGISQSLEPQWRKKKYGKQLWYQEYERFSDIFFRDWVTGEPGTAEGHNNRRIIAGLPGNHDLGFARGIQIPSRDRFQAFFGDSNRIDLIANHTFISIDSVSLSAKDDEAAQDAREIWGPVEEFLEHALEKKAEKLQRHFSPDETVPKPNQQEHSVVDAEKATNRNLFESTNYSVTADFPTILLSHVPLFRNPGTPCGPLRERYPPTPPPPGQSSPVEPDERNALSISRGWQYQNVISRPLTSFIIDKLGGTVEYAFSGDDHDYCEVVHRAYPSRGAGIREITVKSFSWAMGVWNPGFLMVSLWNPVDKDGKRIKSEKDQAKTMQTHLCLLPDQRTILIKYGVLFGLSAIILLVRAFLVVYIPSKFGGGPQSTENPPLLPSFTVIGATPTGEKPNQSFRQSSTSANYNTNTFSASSSASSSEDAHTVNRSGRNGAGQRPRSPSPRPVYGYGIGTARTPSPGSSGHRVPSDKRGVPSSVALDKRDANKYSISLSTHSSRRKLSKAETLTREWLKSMGRTAWVAMFYFWWVWNR